MTRFVWVALTASLAAGQEQPAFKTEVNLVSTTLLVRSAGGALITDLKKDDFEVLEDGIPQSIQFFAREEELPLSLALVVDVSGSQDRFLKRHNKDIETFLKTVLRPSDRAAAICFGNHLRLISDMTPSADQIVDGLKSFVKGQRSFPEIGPKERRVLGTALYDAVFFTARETLRQAGESRKAIVLFSDGEENASEHDLLDAIEAAQSEDTIVYCIRYTGSERKNDELTARNKYGIRALKHLSGSTGGADFDALESDLGAVFADIGKELHALYAVGYVSTNPARDGGFRKLTIRCKRPKSLVRAKSGYYAR